RTSDGRRRGGPGVSRDGGPRRRADRVDKGEGRVGEGNAEGGEIGVGQVEPFDPPGPDRIEAVPEKFGGRGRAAVDPHDSFVAPIDEPEVAEQRRQAAPEPGVDHAIGGQRAGQPQRRASPGRQEGMVRAGGIEGGVVGVLDEEPSAGPHRRRHPGERRGGIVEMAEQRPAVDEIEGRLLQRVGADVVPAHRHRRAEVPAEEPGVEVGGHDVADRADPGGQPAGHRPDTGADFEAGPAGGDADRVEAPERERVVARLEQLEPAPFVGGRFRGGPVVRRHWVHRPGPGGASGTKRLSLPEYWRSMWSTAVTVTSGWGMPRRASPAAISVSSPRPSNGPVARTAMAAPRGVWNTWYSTSGRQFPSAARKTWGCTGTPP